MMTAVNNARRIVSGTYFPIKLNQASVKKAFTEHVLPICCPHWKIEHVDCTHLADGVTNMLVAVSRGPTITPEYLMRVNGHYTELYLDREYEVAVIHALGKAGIGPALHCQFDNGLCYGFIPGRMLELEELCDPVMSYKIAARLAYFHSTSPPPICGKVTGQARIFQTLTDWMAWIESTTKVTERCEDNCCVCMYVRMYVCMYVCMYVFACNCVFAYIYCTINLELMMVRISSYSVICKLKTKLRT